MSPKYVKYLLFPALVLMFPIIVPAQSLPSLPKASEVTTGRLDNGISYYIVSNPSAGGRADIALVQKVGIGHERPSTAGETRVRARAGITDLPHFMAPSPLGYMAGNGILPRQGGYVTVASDATRYSFEDLDLVLNKNVVDSTLLLVFDIIGTADGPMAGMYAPANQAIIVSGDVDASAVRSKMDMLSLLVLQGQASQAKDTLGKERPAALEILPAAEGTSSVSVTYSSPRVPEESIATVQSLVSRKMMGELEIILRRRLERAFALADIPVRDISFIYKDSGSTPGDETFSVSVTTLPSSVLAAVDVLGRCFCDLDSEGASAREYAAAQTGQMLSGSTSLPAGAISNADWVDRCTAAFLYGASLASPSAERNFFKGRNMDASRSAELFNGFIAAIIDRSANLSFKCSADSATALQVPMAFDKAWTAQSLENHRSISIATDTTSLRRSPAKTKLKSDAAEPLSGGRIWTFANGIKVIFKKAGSDGLVRYTWLLKGGSSSVPQLESGEAAYLSDMLYLSDVAGYDSFGFREVLSSGGITIGAETGYADFRLSGQAPASKVPLLMRSLLALCYDRRSDRQAFEYYRHCQQIPPAPGDPEYRKAVLDSILTSGSPYSTYKRPLSLSDDFPARAERFFSQTFAKMNDGVLIMVGDCDEETLKKVLCQYIGGFRTDKVGSYRSRSQSSVMSGNRTVYSHAVRPSLDLAFSTPLDYSVDNLLAATTAVYGLTAAVSQAAALKGWTASAEWNFSMFPQERLNVDILMDIADRSGLPASMNPSDSVDVVLAAVREEVSALARRGLSSIDIASARSVMTGAVKSWSSDPQATIGLLVLRYSYGKDLMTRQNEKIAAVTKDKINAIVKALASGTIAAHAVRGVREVEVVVEAPQEDPGSPFEGSFSQPSDSTGIGGLFRELYGDVKWTEMEAADERQ